MLTNKNTLSPIRRGLGRSLRTSLISFAAAGAVATSTLVGEREASANIVTDVASMFVQNTISCLASGNTKNFGMCVLKGQTSSYSLSSSDLSSIKDIVSEELDEHSLTELSAQSDGVISDASEYYRNETQSISALQQSYAWAESIHDDAEDVMDTLVAYGLDGAKGYYVLASIRHAMLVEMYNIEVAKNALGVAAGSGEYLLGSSDLASFRTNRIQSEAQEVASYLGDWSDDVDTAFGSVFHDFDYSSHKTRSACFVFLVDNGWYRDVTSQYCYSDPTSASGTTCHEYKYWRCTYQSGNNFNQDTDDKTEAAAKIALKQAKIDYRKDTIGELVYETIHAFEMAAGGDFERCGDGTCAIGEVDDCSADCTETSSTTGTFDQWASYTSWNTSATTTLLQNEDASLKWQSDGNLVLYATNGSVIWASRTYGNGADTLSFQVDGNLVIYDGSAYIWGTQTTTGTGATKPTKMILVGEVLHLVDSNGLSVWNSDTDWNRHSAGYDGSTHNTNDNPSDSEDSYSGRFCLDNSAKTTLLKTGDLFGYYRYKLDWQTDGNLVMYNDSGSLWSSSTSSSGKYLCNQEDGNLVIYDEEHNALWHSDTAFVGVGGQLQLVRDQLRVTTASGDILWASGPCTSNDCQYAVKSTSSFSYTKTSSSQTVLETGKAKLVLTSAGYLQIVNKATSSALWTSSVSGTTASFSSGTLKVGSTSINATAGSKLFLVDCNLFIGDSSTNKPVYSTDTTCD
jgi:hypothetical protein